MKQAVKIQHFLSLTTPKVSTDLFPADAATELMASFKTVLKRTSEELLDLTIAAREDMDAKLCREAETVMVDIHSHANMDGCATGRIPNKLQSMGSCLPRL